MVCTAISQTLPGDWEMPSAHWNTAHGLVLDNICCVRDGTIPRSPPTSTGLIHPPVPMSVILLKDIYRLGWPMFVGQIAVMANGFIDTIMAGRYSTLDLAGVGVAFYVMAALRTRLRDKGWFTAT